MSLWGSKTSTWEGNWRPLPPGCTDVYRSPATTCALVTTRSLPATQPLPSMPRSQAWPRIRTTDPPAVLTPGV